MQTRAAQAEPAHTAHVPPEWVVWVTGGPGEGKTTFIKRNVFGTAGSAVDLQEWPLYKEGTQTQVVWHTHRGGRIVVAGAYTYPNTDQWSAKRRGTSPDNGGTDVLQPQSLGLLAKLVEGTLPQAGAPEVIIIEGCSKKKVCTLTAAAPPTPFSRVPLSHPQLPLTHRASAPTDGRSAGAGGHAER